MRKFANAIFILIFAASFCGCSTPSSSKTVVLVTDQQGTNDHSYSQIASEAIKKISPEHSWQTKTIVPTSSVGYIESLSKAAEAATAFVLASSPMLENACALTALSYPDVCFVLIDAAADLNMDGIQDAPNIYSALFAHDEMGYIAGYAAGLKTQGFAGFISEEDSPACKEYEAGFVAGAKAANPEAEPIIVYLQPGRTSAATIAEIEGLAGLGIDIAFSIVEKQEYVSALSKTPLQLITVSTLTPQPANRVMSVCKEYGNAISIIANDYANGRFIGQMRVFSAREKCISFISVDDAFMSQSLLAKLNEMAKTLGTFDIPITD